MATSIDIVNQALAHLGNKANVASIDPPDGTAEAGWAARFYNTSVYRALEHHDWSFARKRVTLNAVANPSTTWAYAYAKPSDCLVARRILTDEATQFEDDSEAFSIEGTTILTNKAAAVLVYTAPVADAALFTSAFCDVVAAELAAFLAGPILRGDDGVKAMGDLRKLALALASDAAGKDGRNEQRSAIVSQALAHLSNKGDVSTEMLEGVATAGLATRFYKTSILRALEHHDWSFARKRVALTPAANPSTIWAHAYAKPADCVAARRILTDEATQFEDDSEAFTIEGTTILTNKDSAVLVYTASVLDPSLFTAAFTDVVAAELAAFLAGPVLRGEQGVNAMGELRKLAFALASDAASKDGRNEHRSEIVRQALAHLRTAGEVSTEMLEGAAAAGLASRFYKTSVYRALEHHDWSFARKRLALTPAANPSGIWAFAYSKPADCLAARRILTGDSTDFEDDSAPFSIEGSTIFSDKDAAVLVYTAPVLDASLFTAAFTDVVAAELAAFLAGPVLRGADGAKAMGDLRQLAASLASDAAAKDGGNERRNSIVTQALAHLRSKAAGAAPPDGTNEASWAARFYKTTVYRALERHDWSFARKRATLVTTANPSSAWLYAYTMPTDCLAPRRIATGDATQRDDDTAAFTLEGTTILTDKQDAVLIYTTPVTNSALFTPTFSDVVAAELAALLAGSVLKGGEGVRAMADLRRMATALIAGAAALDGRNDQRDENQYTPASLRARG